MPAKKISEASIGLRVDGSKVSSDINRIQKKADARLKTAVQGLNRTFNRLSIGLAAGLSGGVVAGFTSLTSAVNKARGELDELSKTARRLDIPLDQLQVLSHVAEEAGVSTSNLTGALGRMVDSVADVASGITTSKGLLDAFESLNLSAQELQNLSPEQQFRRIATELNRIQNVTQRTRIATDIFGRSGGIAALQLAPGVAGGAIGESRGFLSRIGGLTTSQQGRDIERLNDTIGRTSKIFEAAVINFTGQIAGPLADAIGVINKQLEDISKQNIQVIVTEAATSLDNLSQRTDIVVKAFDVIGEAVVKIGSAISFLTWVIPQFHVIRGGFLGLTAAARLPGALSTASKTKGLGALTGKELGDVIGSAIKGAGHAFFGVQALRVREEVKDILEESFPSLRTGSGDSASSAPKGPGDRIVINLLDREMTLGQLGEEISKSLQPRSIATSPFDFKTPGQTQAEQLAQLGKGIGDLIYGPSIQEQQALFEKEARTIQSQGRAAMEFINQVSAGVRLDALISDVKELGKTVKNSLHDRFYDFVKLVKESPFGDNIRREIDKAKNALEDLSQANLDAVITLRELNRDFEFNPLRLYKDRLADIAHQIVQENIPWSQELGEEMKKLSVNIEEETARISTAWQSVESATIGAIDRLVEEGKFKFRDFINDIIKQFAKLELQKLFFGQGGQGGLFSFLGLGLGNIGLPVIEGRASGGPVGAGKMALVGEQGPELVRFKTDAHVYSNNQSRKMMSGGGITVNQTFMPGVSRADLAAEAARIKSETIQAVSAGMRDGGALAQSARIALR